MNHAGSSTTARAPMSVVRRMTRAFGTLTAACALAVGLASCAGDMYDPASGATKKDYEGLVGRRGQDKLDAAKAGEAPPIPAFQSVLAAPSAPELADTRRVSLAVTETTPVRDILIELARKAEVDLELDPRISGGIVMSVTDRPFIDVVERVTDLAELRYKFDKNVLKVELDDPYLEQYRMDVLNQSRSSSGSIASSTDASSASSSIGTGGGGAGGNNKSESSVTSKSDNNFWESIGQNIGQILNNIQSRRGEAGRNLNAQFIPPAQVEKAEAESARGEKPSDEEASGVNPQKMIAQAGALGKRQGTLDALAQEGLGGKPAPELKAAAAGEAGAGGGGALATNFSVNAQAGIITVFATKRQHAAIDKYLRAVRNSVLQQVLVEAKILEITLNDQYRSGINWQAFLGPNNSLGITTNFSRSVVTGDTGTPTVGVSWRDTDGDLSIAAQLVKQFGSVRTLSSPRITVLNNQSAILKVAQNQIFFDLDVSRQPSTVSGQPDTVTVDSEIKSVPVGLIMSVQPAVDPTTKRINMGLRPSVTRITGYVSDPGVAIAVAQAASNGSTVNVSSQIPIIEVREMDSMVTMESGQTVVMGGLMQETSENTREGLPGAMDVPVLGQAVSQNIRGSKVSELVVFIRATVVNDRDTVADEDIRLYKTFTPDPRPIAF
jgi:general secretion pathway protein D